MTTKLTLTAYNRKKKKIAAINPFSVMINPESITISQSVGYSESEADKENAKFKGLGHCKISIPKIILDTTGIIPQSEWPNGRTDVLSMIDDLKKIVCRYEGKEHEPPIVHVQWGSSIYWSRMTSLNFQYTLFNSAGVPVRAEVTFEFNCFKTEQEIQAEKNKSSPDLTHLVEVQVGDTLPLMCERVYNNSAMYLQVARFNGLTNFRHLKVGSRLVFPPIVD